ncbi:unnamed protein product, partial [Musa acuminata subsp. burmannicoides]
MKRMLMEIQEVARVKLNLSRIYQIGFISNHFLKKKGWIQCTRLPPMRVSFYHLPGYKVSI